MNDLTPKQTKLLKYITDYSSNKGYPPSLREMADYLGVRSLSTVHQHLEVLRSKGYIEKSISRQRNITSSSLPKVPKLVRIPLLGTIAAGLPLEPIEDPSPVYISTQIVKDPKDHYALRVNGDSMIDDGIQDKDIVVIKAQNFIDRLDQIIVAISDGGATLKRFGGVTQDGYIKLLPRNPKMEVIYADPATFSVSGIFVGLIRGI